MVAVAGAPTARRALGLFRRGVLDRDALAAVAVVACFATGVIEILVARGAFTPPLWMAALGFRAAQEHAARGAWLD